MFYLEQIKILKPHLPSQPHGPQAPVYYSLMQKKGDPSSKRGPITEVRWKSPITGLLVVLHGLLQATILPCPAHTRTLIVAKTSRRKFIKRKNSKPIQ